MAGVQEEGLRDAGRAHAVRVRHRLGGLEGDRIAHVFIGHEVAGRRNAVVRVHTDDHGLAVRHAVEAGQGGRFPLAGAAPGREEVHDHRVPAVGAQRHQLRRIAQRRQREGRGRGLGDGGLPVGGAVDGDDRGQHDGAHPGHDHGRAQPPAALRPPPAAWFFAVLLRDLGREPAVRPGLRGDREHKLEGAARAGRAAHAHLTGVAEGDRADQGQPETGAAGTAPGRPGPESLEDVIDRGRRDALTGVLDHQPGRRRIVVAGHRDPDHVAGAGVLDGVLQQGIHGQLEALPVGGHRHRIELPGRPDPAGGGLPAPQRLDEEAVQGDRRREEKFGIF